MKIAVIGVGYIGTIISQVISSNGFEVIGVDSSKKNIDKLSKGKCDIQEPGLEKLLKKNKSKIKYYSDFENDQIYSMFNNPALSHKSVKLAQKKISSEYDKNKILHVHIIT